MKLDPDKVLERFEASEHPNAHFAPLLVSRDREVATRVIRAIAAELNATIDRALYTTDASALERLGTMIAEHALGRTEIVPCALAPDHSGACCPGPVEPGAARCRDTETVGSFRQPFLPGGTLVYHSPDDKRTTFEIVAGRDGSVHLEVRKFETGRPLRHRDTWGNEVP